MSAGVSRCRRLSVCGKALIQRHSAQCLCVPDDDTLTIHLSRSCLGSTQQASLPLFIHANFANPDRVHAI